MRLLTLSGLCLLLLAVAQDAEGFSLPLPRILMDLTPVNWIARILGLESEMSEPRMHRTIHWFRKGLRLHDNPALMTALASSEELHAVFILDPWFVKNAHVGVNRWRFLAQSLTDLDESFKKYNTRLHVIRGKPEEEFPKLFKRWRITRLTFELDTEPYAVLRDSEIEKLALQHGVDVVKRVSHTLYDTGKIIAKNGGSPPLTYQKLVSMVSKMGSPPAALEINDKHFEECSVPVEADYDQTYYVPTLDDLGVDTSDLGPDLFPGGESEALRRLEKSLEKKDWVCKFEKPKTSPNSLTPSTTVLSPYLKFGCLSPRLFYHKLTDVYKSCKNHTQPPVSLHGQLLWREFFYTVATGTPNFDKMVGNPVCRQIPWGNNTEHLEAWKHGRTGFPWIDAIMTQLRTEGWIHHLARHSVACFLTRGDLWISWEEGQKVFEELLLDADWSLNAGNWMWLSASAFFHQYFRVYSPIAFGKNTDKHGDYIRKYLPKLSGFPDQYIYEPWKAPRKLQEKLGCIIGEDYPRPIVDHDIVRKENLAKMAAAYKAGKSDNGGSKRKSEGGEESPAKKSKRSTKTNNRKMTEFLKK